MTRRIIVSMVVAVAWRFIAPAALEAQNVRLVPVAGGFDQPVSVIAPHDGSRRIFVVEQGGRVILLRDGVRQAEPFLDIRSRVSCCGERGLLDMALDPSFELNGHVWVNYTNSAGNTVISRFTTAGAAASASSELVVLTVEQPFTNHNGGQLRFGPDGFLYIALGDGGSAGDPGNRAQRLDTLLGKLLRIDVRQGAYSIPAGNPFAGTAGARPEIWALGLRNPWRFSFDRDTGNLWIADVGQSRLEEVNLQPSSSGGGQNYGWRTMEGTSCYSPPSGCATTGLTLPVIEYGHGEGCSITGGYVYRGRAIPSLRGRYVFGDLCSGTIWAARASETGWQRELLLETTASITSFGETSAGELLVVDYAGTLYRIDPVPVKLRGARR